MLKLLRAGFARLALSKTFRIYCGYSAAIGAALPVFMRFGNGADVRFALTDVCLIAYTAVVPLVLSLWMPLFIGAEHSDGGFRNKIIVGSKRSHIYLSNLLICAAAGAAFSIVYMAAYIPMTLILSGGFSFGAEAFILPAICAVLGVSAFSSVFLVVTMLISNKTTSAFVCRIIAGGALGIGMYFSSYFYSVFEAANGREDIVIYAFVSGFQPCSIILAVTSAYGDPIAMLSGSLAAVAAATAVGMLLFSRKDIK